MKLKKNKFLNEDYIKKAIKETSGHIVNLKEKKFNLNISFGREDFLKLFFGHKRIALFSGVFFVLFVFTLSYIFLFVKADRVNFYPNSCLGGWENPQNAQGKPELEAGADSNEFDDENSAILKENTMAPLFCGGFEGEIPGDGAPLKSTLHLSIYIKGENEPVAKDVPGENVPIIQEIKNSDSPKSSDEIKKEGDELENSDKVDLEAGKNDEDVKTDESNDLVEPEKKVDESSENKSLPLETPSAPLIDPPADQNNDPVQNQPTSFFRKIFPFVFAQEIEEKIINEGGGGEDNKSDEIIIKQEVKQEEELEVVGEEKGEGDVNLESKEPTEGDALDDKKEEGKEIKIENPFLQLVYSTDGTNWSVLKNIDSKNWKDIQIDLPFFNWEVVSSLQIGLRNSETADFIPQVYLDGMWIEVEYKGSEDPIPKPDFVNDVILFDETFSGNLRVIKIEKAESKEIQLWYSPNYIKPEIKNELAISKKDFNLSIIEGNLLNSTSSSSTPEIIESNATSSSTEIATDEIISDKAPLSDEVVSDQLLLEEPSDQKDVDIQTKKDEEEEGELVSEIEIKEDSGVVPEERVVDENQWYFVAGGNLIEKESIIDFDSGSLFWLSKNIGSIYGINIETGGMFSQSYNPSQGENFIEYPDQSSAKKKASVLPGENGIMFEEIKIVENIE